jgi:prepilin-type N-terminal cleavage/methylation domain-containing protein
MRRGFTLIEMLISLVVLGIVASMTVILLQRVALTTSRVTGGLGADRTTLSLRRFLERELGDATQNDVAAAAPASFDLERSVGMAPVCLASGAAIFYPDTAWHGARIPEAGRDVAWLLVDPLTAQWDSVAITAVGTDRCPGDTAPATRIDLASSGAGAVVIRVMEPVELRAYQSGVADWLGLLPADHSSPVQPFAGPLIPGTTLFELRSGALAATVRPAGRGSAITATIPLAPP